jgi:phage terminase small subunit
MQKRLTMAQSAFVEALMADPRGNASAAARAAGIGEKRCALTAWEWQNDPRYTHVQAELKRRREEKLKELDVTDDEIWRGIAAVAKGDISEVVQWGTDAEGKSYCRYTPHDELSERGKAMVKQVSVFSSPYGDVVQVQLQDKLEAWKQLAKMRGLTRERIDINANINIAVARESLKSKLAGLAAPGIPGPVPPESQ